MTNEKKQKQIEFARTIMRNVLDFVKECGISSQEILEEFQSNLYSVEFYSKKNQTSIGVIVAAPTPETAKMNAAKIVGVDWQRVGEIKQHPLGFFKQPNGSFEEVTAMPT